MSGPELPGFTAHDLGEGLWFLTGALPAELVWGAGRFDEVWALHPEEKHVINMPGGPVETPRWQQAYGADYHYTGRTNSALPVPLVLEPLRAWARQTIDPRLNGLLLNWYEGPGHYIGPHHDSTVGLVVGSPIVTVSLGEERTFRLTRPETRGRRDFPTFDGAVFVTPWETNLVWRHDILKAAGRRGRRISVTLRAFAG